MVLVSSVNLFAQATYETKTKIVDGYIVGKKGDEIAFTRIVLKVTFEQEKGQFLGAIRNVRVIASSHNGIDFTSSKTIYCNLSEEWSSYMKKREGRISASYYKSSSWQSPNNLAIENFYLIDELHLKI